MHCYCLCIAYGFKLEFTFILPFIEKKSRLKSVNDPITTLSLGRGKKQKYYGGPVALFYQ